MTFGDIGGYDAPLDKVIRRQIEQYHKIAIADLTRDLAKNLVKERDKTKIENIRAQVANFKNSENSEIIWHKAVVIASYSELYDMTMFESIASDVMVSPINKADLFDEFWKQSGKYKRPLSDINPRPKRNLPDSLRASPVIESGFTGHFDTGDIRKFSLMLAQQAIEMLVPSAHATALLCGNLSGGEMNCPPDRNFVPDNPSWYVTISKPYSETPDYLSGVAFTLVDWSSEELRAFSDFDAAHCYPVPFIGGNAGANCRTQIGTLQEDVIFVPDSIYEAGTSIPNPSCSFRTGNRTVDFWTGCFSAYYGISTFPSAYVDTTFSDDFDDYSATVGTYRGVFLNASQLYVNYIYFDARRETLPALQGKVVKTNGQIGTRIPLTFASPFCVFAVDTSATINDAVLHYPFL